MGCCPSQEALPEQYVTESDEEVQNLGVLNSPHEGGSYSSSSSESFVGEDTPLTPRSRIETAEAFKKNNELRGSPGPRPRLKGPVVNTPTLHHGFDEDGTHYVNEYIIVKTIGRGMYGKVKLCIHRESGVSYAIKIINKVLLAKKRKGGFAASSMLDDVMKEIHILKMFDHPNVVKLFEVIDDDHDDKLYMIFEFVRGGALMKGVVKQEPLEIVTARRYIRDIVLGLEYLHHHHIIHRDIKPENLLAGEDGIKISDFGVSHYFADEDLLERTDGSPAFLAPEVVSGEGQFHGKPVDVWALGVTLYSFVFGTLPFMAESEFAIYDAIREAPLKFPHSVDSILEDLLVKLLDKNPKTRITVAEIKTHPWVTLGGAAPMEDQHLPPFVPPSGDVLSYITNQRVKVVKQANTDSQVDGDFPGGYSNEHGTGRDDSETSDLEENFHRSLVFSQKAPAPGGGASNGSLGGGMGMSGRHESEAKLRGLDFEGASGSGGNSVKVTASGGSGGTGSEGALGGGGRGGGVNNNSTATASNSNMAPPGGMNRSSSLRKPEGYSDQASEDVNGEFFEGLSENTETPTASLGGNL